MDKRFHVFEAFEYHQTKTKHENLTFTEFQLERF